MSKRRGHGEGSVYYDERRNRYVGSIDLGRDGRGRRQRRRVVGRTVTGVQEKVRALRSELESGRAVGAAHLSVGTWLDRWADGLDSRVEHTTARSYRTAIRLHLKPALGRRLLVKLDVTDCDRLWAAKLGEGHRPNNIRIMRATLRKALHDAERLGLVGRNVAALSVAPKVQQPEGRSMTAAQARAFLAAVSDHRLFALWVLAFGFGPRRGELAGLSWSDYDDGAATMVVRQQVRRRYPPNAPQERRGESWLELVPLKTGARGRRTLELTPKVVSVLAAHRARQAEERLRAGPMWADLGLMFPNEFGGPLDPDALGRTFTTLADRASLGHWHIHETRHTAATLMLASGAPLEVVSRVLGHSSIRVTADTYGHLLGGEKRRAAEAMTALLMG